MSYIIKPLKWRKVDKNHMIANYGKAIAILMWFEEPDKWFYTNTDYTCIGIARTKQKAMEQAESLYRKHIRQLLKRDKANE